MSEHHHSIIKSIFSKKMLIVGLMGFSSGLPLLLVGSTLKAWLTESNVDLKVIGFFSLVQIPYSFKFLWAPLMDHFKVFSFGRRKSWLLLSQLALAGAMLLLSLTNPGASIQLVGSIAVLIAFLSASQDIVVDAYRRESLDAEEQGLGSSIYVNFYRIALLVSGGFALYLADHVTWSQVYQIMAVIMLVSSVCTLLAPEPNVLFQSKNLATAFTDPLKEFFSRKNAWLILSFIVLYKVGESMASDMTTPFYLKIGFTKTEIAGVVKFFGFWATILGAFTGGLLLIRMTAGRALLLFGCLQSLALFGFSILATQGAQVKLLAIVITAENFTSGMATSALLAFMANQCDKRFSATQYSLLSSLASVPRVLAGSLTGILATQLGWPSFFLICTLITIPGIALVFRLRRVDEQYRI
jgi:PAT family beta-lactamase induction signal transducer AmpG